MLFICMWGHEVKKWGRGGDHLLLWAGGGEYHSLCQETGLIPVSFKVAVVKMVCIVSHICALS